MYSSTIKTTSFSMSSNSGGPPSKYTEDEAREIARKIFAQYDRNKNGTLDDHEGIYYNILKVSSMMIMNYKSLSK